MIFITLTYSIFIVLLTIFFKKKKIFSNYTGDNHQLFSNQKNIPLVGGIFLLLPIILINHQNYIFSILIITIFLLGFCSDRKFLISAKKRFLFQIIIVFCCVIFLNLEIATSRLVFFDNFLQNYIFNIFFTSFCLLILINGANFIDGLNGLLMLNMTSVIFILFKFDLINVLTIDKNFISYFFFIITILIILNLFNLLMLGDAGAYILSFFVGYLIIKCHFLNTFISPYFFITLLWYPCFENLFSIIRKLKTKFSPLSPDNNHLHQLLYVYLKNILIKNKLLANNISSLLISIFNLTIIFISSINFYSSIYQIKIIIFSIIIYSILFILLEKKIKKLKG